MSYTPLTVRYGTAVAPWHSLSLFYHDDTPLPLKRDCTKAPCRVPVRWESLGQVDSSVTMPIFGIAAGLFALALIGGAAAERHQRSLYSNRRPRRNRRRRR